MLVFQPLQIEDIPKLRNYFQYNSSRICDTTLGTTFMWRDFYKTEYSLYHGSLYFKVMYGDAGETFSLPLGGGRLEHYQEIANYCINSNIPIQFFPVPKDELVRLQTFFPNCTVSAIRDSFDYLYRAEDLMYFRGKKYSGQRNHINKFLKTCSNWIFVPMQASDAPIIKDFLTQYAAHTEKTADSYFEELTKTIEVIDHFTAYDMCGGLLFVNHTLVGFSLGEIVGDTLFIHIEKANRHVNGCYQMLVSQFAQHYAGGRIAFINREDDTGDTGLRTSKLSYHPVSFIEKHLVKAVLP